MIINTFRVFTLLFLLLSLNVIVATADDDHDIKDNEFGEEWNSCRCGIRPSQQRIVNGDEVFPHAYPWLVALVHSENPTKLMCGGTLLSNLHVLTAGHCFRNYKGVQLSADQVIVRLGAHNLSELSIGIQLSIEQVTVFPIFKYSSDTLAPIYDLTLIRLNQSVPLNNKIRPICLHSLEFAREIPTMLPLLNEFDKKNQDAVMLPSANKSKKRKKRETIASEVGFLFSSPKSPKFNGKLSKLTAKIALRILRRKIRLWDRLANDSIKRYRVVCIKYQAMNGKCAEKWVEIVKKLQSEREKALKDDNILKNEQKNEEDENEEKSKDKSDDEKNESNLSETGFEAKNQQIIVNHLFNLTDAQLPTNKVVGWIYTNDLVKSFLNKQIEKNRKKKVPIVKQKKHWRFVIRPLFVSGWGSTSPDGSSEFLSDTPRHAALKELPIESCSVMYGSNVVDVRRSLCNGNHGKDACAGDSGGPVMSFRRGRANLRGAVSFGDMCGSPFSPSTNTLIDPYLSWLLWEIRTDKFCFD